MVAQVDQKGREASQTIQIRGLSNGFGRTLLPDEESRTQEPEEPVQPKRRTLFNMNLSKVV